MKKKSRNLILKVILIGMIFTLSGCGCDHEYDEGVITKEPTCLEEGEKTYTCNLCQKKKTETIPLAEHKYDEGDVTKEPTCTEEGIKTLTCTVCNTTKEETMPTKQHEYVEEITKEATFEEEGIKTFTCKNCGDSYTEPIPVRDDKVVLTVTDKKDYPQDINARRFSPFVEFICQVENMTDKDIKGIQGKLIINDLFGVEIMTLYWDIIGQNIPAHGSITQTDYGFEINEFLDYHMQVYNTDLSDLQFKYEVMQIIYTDGTSESFD